MSDRMDICVRALREIASRPTIERNPDGVDQAADTMRLIAQEALEEMQRAIPKRGAVSALEFYAAPATWDVISEHGTVTTSTPAKRDGGQRARDALADHSRGAVGPVRGPVDAG